MKYGTELETDRLVIRSWNLSEDDRQVFHELNSDKQIMHYFPFRRSREVADKVLEKIITVAVADGYGWAAICIKDSGQPIGFAGLSKVNFEVDFTPATEIGWRLIVRHWHKGYASEAATALVAHGFEDLCLDEIVSFALPANTASIAVMQRLGMRRDPSRDFDMPGIDDADAELRRHVFYCLSMADWK
jgi:RimJ/RimL family protein N-acetyltransferase